MDNLNKSMTFSLFFSQLFPRSKIINNHCQKFNIQNIFFIILQLFVTLLVIILILVVFFVTFLKLFNGLKIIQILEKFYIKPLICNISNYLSKFWFYSFGGSKKGGPIKK